MHIMQVIIIVVMTPGNTVLVNFSKLANLYLVSVSTLMGCALIVQNPSLTRLRINYVKL